MEKKIVIIDGYGILFRAYHSLPPLTRSDGVPVGAIYGFTNMLIKLMANLDFSHIAVALDSGVKSFRNKVYEQYKAHRPAVPDDLVPQFPLVRELMEAMNIITLEKQGYEADDLIATYGIKAKNAGYKVVIVSSDKDLMQLVIDNQIIMYDPFKDLFINEARVEEKFGVKPSQLIDVLAMMGDSADNIPGIPGIGPKTAAQLINAYGNLEVLYENINHIKQNKRRETIIANKELAYLSKKLITLEENADNNYAIDDLIKKDFHHDLLYAFLIEQNFHSILTRLNVKPSSDAKIVQRDDNKIYNVTNASQLESIYDLIQREGEVSLYYNYTSKNKTLNNLVLHVKQQSYIVCPDNYGILDEFLYKIFTQSSILKITHNVKLLGKLFKLNLSNFVAFEDVELMSYLVANNMIQHDIETLLSYHMHFSSTSDDLNYISANRASLLNDLYRLLKHKLWQAHSYMLYEKIEKPLIKVLFSMEDAGVQLDLILLNDLSKKFKLHIENLQEAIFKRAGQEFNIGSPKQLSDILYNHLGIKIINNKKAIIPKTTNAETLEDIAAAGHSIADEILKWRHYTKLCNTYVDALPKQIDHNNRVHTTYLMTQTTTGRLSSIDPNLQNIPIRTHEGSLIRSAFTAKSGYLLIIADYSQIELRLLSQIAGITSLIQAFNNNIDIHARTASELFEIPLGEVDSELRRRAKTINFGIIYGISAYGLASRLKIPHNVAKIYIDKYFIRYPQIKKYMQDIINFARTQGYVKTSFGRRCFLPNINSKNFALRSFAERAAINAPLQGSQADIIKKVMVKIHDHLNKYYKSSKMILQVHDELVFEVKEDQAEEISSYVKQTMQNIVAYDVNLIANIGIQKKWQK